MYTNTSICVCIHTYIQTLAYIYVHPYRRKQIQIQTHTSTHNVDFCEVSCLWLCVCMYACMHAFMHECMYVLLYKHTHTCTYTHMYVIDACAAARLPNNLHTHHTHAFICVLCRENNLCHAGLGLLLKFDAFTHSSKQACTFLQPQQGLASKTHIYVSHMLIHAWESRR